MQKNATLVQQLQQMGHRLHECGLVASAEGNISLRGEKDTVYLSGRGARLGRMQDKDVVVADFHGKVLCGEGTPTSEYMLHTSIYQRHRDINAVVHTHGPHATAVAVVRASVPPIVDEMTILLGGGLDVAAYAPPGSEALAQNCLAALDDKKAALLANHGAVAVGTDLDDVIKNALLAENVCRVFLLAQTAGRVHQIDPEAFETQRAIYRRKRGGA